MNFESDGLKSEWQIERWPWLISVNIDLGEHNVSNGNGASMLHSRQQHPCFTSSVLALQAGSTLVDALVEPWWCVRLRPLQKPYFSFIVEPLLRYATKTVVRHRDCSQNLCVDTW